jgi:hypothetical protein
MQRGDMSASEKQASLAARRREAHWSGKARQDGSANRTGPNSDQGIGDVDRRHASVWQSMARQAGAIRTLTAVIGRWRNILLPVWAMLSAGLQTNGAFVVARCRRAPLRFGGGWQKNL